MSELVTADTSVVVPSLTDWHEHHEVALEAVESVTRLPAHVLFETVSVLTRLPGGLAQPLRVAFDVLSEAFPDEPLTPAASAHVAIIASLAGADLSGGAVYDGLVGGTARYWDARLLSLDRRARRVYHAIGVDVLWLSES